MRTASHRGLLSALARPGLSEAAGRDQLWSTRSGSRGRVGDARARDLRGARTCARACASRRRRSPTFTRRISSIRRTYASPSSSLKRAPSRGRWRGRCIGRARLQLPSPAWRRSESTRNTASPPSRRRPGRAAAASRWLGSISSALQPAICARSPSAGEGHVGHVGERSDVLRRRRASRGRRRRHRRPHRSAPPEPPPALLPCAAAGARRRSRRRAGPPPAVGHVGALRPAGAA